MQRTQFTNSLKYPPTKKNVRDTDYIDKFGVSRVGLKYFGDNLMAYKYYSIICDTLCKASILPMLDIICHMWFSIDKTLLLNQ
jgi:hypothetical protein